MLRSCEDMVAALDAANVSPLGPWVVGDYFPGMSPKQLAEKPDLCAGAEPQQHSHFFTSDGAFGSLDQAGNQVDDGAYQVRGGSVIFGDPDSHHLTWHFTVDEDSLRLTPVIPAKLVRLANTDPSKPNDAGYLVAVAVAGRSWHRVPCEGWC